jgi:thiamine-monophosphate kinase
MALKAGEFDLIARCFAPLASRGAPAFGLGDDAAVWTPPPGRDIVFTKDALVAGVHFFVDDDPLLVGRKLARVNLSDLAAMGAAPQGYLLAVALPKGNELDWACKFAEGLKLDQAEFGWQLFGGDTTSTPGPITLSLTAIGTVEPGRALRRSGAKVGDRIYVSGSLGDSALGLACLEGELEGLSASARNYLVGRYHLPLPRVPLGLALSGLAHAAIDVSDGIAGDLAHITETSGVGARVYLDRLPMCPAAREALALAPALLANMRKGGDDYELLFTASKLNQDTLARLSKTCQVPITEIGEIVEGNQPLFLDAALKPVEMGGGYRHF